MITLRKCIERSTNRNEGRVMDAGDGASLQDEAAVPLIAQVASEILLFDLR